ncbi:GtrA family protein [Desulfosudis oleivorans]|uniref:GtrA family protein n=1 Tax=Desulfosudis oleivorans TaxID=181663 RepID=UPI0000ED8669|nr:GtrA family protein [Desulfosudis oleivorans]
MKIVKFFTSSVIGTGVDFALFALLCRFIYPPAANIISAGAGMVTNFVLQRRFVFEATRSLPVSFVLSFVFSIGGIFLGSFLIFLLIQIDFFNQVPLAAKVVATGIVFFYNFQTKKFAFEKK